MLLQRRDGRKYEQLNENDLSKKFKTTIGSPIGQRREMLPAFTDFDPIKTGTFAQDPYKYLGYGLIFSLLLWLFLLTLLGSLLLAPLIYLYQTGDMYDMNKMAHYTMGNMGFSSQQCVSTPLHFDSLGFNCQGGKI